MGKHFVCAYCGASAYRSGNTHDYKYCSTACYQNARYGEVVQDEIFSARDPLCIEAIKLCQSGLNKREAADRVGIKHHILGDWFHKHGVENETVLFSDRVCGYCGKSLLGMKSLSSRKYCSESCSEKAAYRRKHPKIKWVKHAPELREKALELYWGGLEGALIARQLGIAEGTAHSWIHDFSHRQNRRREPETLRLLPVDIRVESAKEPSEWKKLLSENAPAGDADCVIIVCGSRNGNGGVNNFVTIVFERLKRNPCDGVTYAFCSSGGEQVSTICWRRGTFCLTKFPKAKGGYIWPSSSVGIQIELRKNEFEYLLSLSKKRGAKPRFT